MNSATTRRISTLASGLLLAVAVTAPAAAEDINPDCTTTTAAGTCHYIMDPIDVTGGDDDADASTAHGQRFSDTGSRADTAAGSEEDRGPDGDDRRDGHDGDDRDGPDGDDRRSQPDGDTPTPTTGPTPGSAETSDDTAAAGPAASTVPVVLLQDSLIRAHLLWGAPLG